MGDFSNFSYTFTRDPNEMFRTFFGDKIHRTNSFGETPFMGGIDDFFGGNIFGSSSGGNPFKKHDQEYANIKYFVDLFLSLEELFHGTTKKMKITRISIKLNRPNEFICEINIKPG